MLKEHFTESEDIGADIATSLQSILARTSFKKLISSISDDESIVHKCSFRYEERLTLYPEQRLVAEHILTALNKRLNDGPSFGMMIRFCTPPSTGKSSAAAYLGSMLQTFRNVKRERQHAEESTFLCYSCYSENVRHDVARTCVAAALPFAIVTKDIACPSYACYHGKSQET